MVRKTVEKIVDAADDLTIVAPAGHRLPRISVDEMKFVETHQTLQIIGPFLVDSA